MIYDPLLRRARLLVIIALVWATPLFGQTEPIHVVRSGETLFRISTQYGVSLADLSAWNNLNGNTILVGQTLRLQAPGTNAAVPTPATAAEPPAQAPTIQVIQTRREIVQMEQEYDRYLHGVLAAYFDPSTYFVHTRLQIDEVEIGVRERLVQPAPQRRIDQLLPGLPAIPDYLRNTVDSGTEASGRNGLLATPDIQRIDLEITVDESYTDEQTTTIRDLAASAAKITAARGDRIRVVRRTLPVRPDEEPVVNAPLSPVPDSVTEPAWWMNGWLMAGAVAILLTAVGIYMRRRRPEPRPSATVRGAGFTELPVITTANGPSVQRVTEKIYAGRMERDPSPAEWLLNAFMSHMHDMARLLEDWMATEGEAGLVRASQVLIAADPKLIEALMPLMDPKHGRLLADKVAQTTGHASQTDLLSDMVTDLIEHLKDRQRDSLCFRLRTLRQFDFATHLDADQIRQALRDQHPLNQAFVIAHLDGSTIDQLITSMDEEIIAQVWGYMSRVETLTREDYVSLTEGLFSALTGMTSGDSDWKSSDQILVERACALFERQPIEVQNRLHLRFMSDPSPMSTAVSNRLITMANLDRYEPDQLREIFDEMDVQQLASVLYDQSMEIVREALRNRSPRERQMYASLAVEADSLPSAAHEQARQSMLTRFRQVMRGPATALLVLLLYGCSSTAPSVASEAETASALVVPTDTAAVSASPSIPILDKERFDRMHADYEVMYNRMIADYFLAQTHLANDQLELARAAALRAIQELPTPQTYEILFLISVRTGNKEEMERWRREAAELTAMMRQGKYRMSTGDTIRLRMP